MAWSFTSMLIVPDDPFMSKDGSTQDKINAYESVYGVRTIRVYSNQEMSSGSLKLTHSVGNSADTGDSDISYELSIDFKDDVTTDTLIVVEMAGHIASTEGGFGWGYDGDGDGVSDNTVGNGNALGASGISGGPYHFNLNNIDGTSLGNQDNQLKGGDILPPQNGTISGFKYEDTNGKSRPERR